MTQGMFTLSRAPSTTFHLENYILKIFLYLLAYARWLYISFLRSTFLEKYHKFTNTRYVFQIIFNN